MEIAYELWDVETGNAVGSFATEDEGLEIVRTLLAAFGRSYAAELSLSRREGTDPAKVIAAGDELAALAERSAGQPADIARAAT